jgi:hypothetical protein
MKMTSGWVTYAAVMMAILGTLNVIYGIVLLANSDWVALTPEGQLVFFDFTTWGWILFIVGAIQLFVGWGIMAGQAWATIAGVIIATLGMVSAFLSLNAYPWWSLIVITLAFLVIYGLTVHGGEVAEG